MRWKLASVVFIAVNVAACLPDRHESTPGAAGVAPKDAGARAADAAPPYACSGGAPASLVAGFTPAEPVDYVARLSEHFIADPSWFPLGVLVIDESGTLCATATDVASCRERAASAQWCTAETCPATNAPYELLPDGQWRLYCYGSERVGGVPKPGHYVEELRITRGDDVRLISLRDDLVSFFGAVDTKSEAVYLAIRDGFLDAKCNWSSIVEKDEGFEIPIAVPGDCVRAPGGPTDGPEEIVLRVERDGRTSIVSRRRPTPGSVPRQE